MNIVILAAGMGKRMQSCLPKVLHKVAQKPMLHHVVDTAFALNPTKLVVVVGHGAEQVKQSFNNSNICWAIQDKQLGTGHALMQALPFLDIKVPTLVLYGDVPLIQEGTLKNLIQNAGENLGLLTAFYDNPKGYGRIIRQHGRIVAIVEEKDTDEDEKKINEINTGIMVLPTSKLEVWLAGLKNTNSQGEYYLTDIIDSSVKDAIDVISTHPECGNWESFGVNSKVQLVEVERYLQCHQAKKLLEQGVTLIDHERIDIRGTLTVEQDVLIDVGCIFEGNVHLAQGVHLKPYCIIKDSTIGENTVIESFSHLDSVKIAKNASIGPYARLRPKTELGNNVKVGNFVELKNTKIADNSKVNHLSYIGDANIGKEVNIGAGVITCNYDGVNKHITTIEDNVFIGSDCQLIAPVTIEKGATIGAGTTLTQNAPTEQLTLSRIKQTTISSWRKPVKK